MEMLGVARAPDVVFHTIVLARGGFVGRRRGRHATLEEKHGWERASTEARPHEQLRQHAIRGNDAEA
jgi:hypothetical protein